VELGAQNCHWEDKGAFTGEVSPAMLEDVGCDFVILGHSERRNLFGETDAVVKQKLGKVLRTNLRVIVCVGETLEQREEDRTEAVVLSQLEGCLEGIDADSMSRITVAYEPVWAIGTGRTAAPEQAQEVHRLIRGWLEQQWDKHLAEAVRIQYGGSVKPGNARELMEAPDIDGALVGGASLDAADFAAIVRQAVR
jgi:triosephosphate isomerase